MPKSSSSKRWLKEHFKDPYVKQAQKEGYRSRAVFKLMEIQQRDRLIQPGMFIVDLGAAPGGWSQLAAEWVGSKGRVIALDILPMNPLPGVDFIQGDFTEEAVLAKLQAHIDDHDIDLILSDMAPNMSGVDAIDQPRSMYLAELALDFAKQALKKNGTLLLKMFQGTEFDAFLKQLRHHFAKIVIRKPKASRSRSPEVYVIAKGKIK